MRPPDESEKNEIATNDKRGIDLQGGPTPRTATDAESGYVSMQSGRSAITPAIIEESNSMQQRGRPVPGTDLFIFKKEADPEILRHYERVSAGIDALLREEIDAVGSDPCCNMGMRIAVIGKTEQEATLCLVVFCSPEMERTVNSFFRLTHITSLLNPPSRRNPNYTNAPRLEHLVIPHPPRTRSARLDIDVCCDNTFTAEHGTYCGAPILLQSGRRGSTQQRKRRQATFGGIIKVTKRPGKSKLYGMTAGHLVEDLLEKGNTESLKIAGKGASSSGGCGINGWICEHNILGQIKDSKSLSGVVSRNTEQSHDWALVSIQNPRPNEVVKLATDENSEHTAVEDAVQKIRVATRPAFQDGISDPVSLLSGTRGTLRGELSSLPARIRLGQGNVFVNAYMLELDDASVYDGDSGAWVVHRAGPELYGHVVATDAFGDAFVIPSPDTFNDIRECMGAISVTLPEERDFDKPRLSKKTISGLASQGAFASKDRSRKQWKQVFDQYRHFPQDEPYVEALNQHGDICGEDDLNIGQQSTPPSYVVQEIAAFLKRQQNNSNKNLTHTPRRAWLDDRGFPAGSCRTPQNSMNAHELLKLLGIKRFGVSYLPDADRRLIYIENLDSAYIRALMKTAAFHQIEGLRDAIWKHIALKTSLRVRIPSFGYLIFHLEFHIPYSVLRVLHPSKVTTQGANHQRIDLAFLKMDNSNNLSQTHTIHDAHISLTIIGSDHSRWIAYMFHGLEDEAIEEVTDEDDEEEVEEQENEVQKRMVGDNSVWASETIWNPRLYFLHCLNYRVRSVLREWEYLVRTIEVAVEQKLMKQQTMGYIPVNGSEKGIDNAVNWTVKTMELLRHLNNRLQKTIQSWERFQAPSGDLSYFSDLVNRDGKARLDLDSINESFEELREIAQTVRSMEDHCQNDVVELDLLLSLEKVRLDLENQQLHQRYFFHLKEGNELSLQTNRMVLTNFRRAHVTLFITNILIAVTVPIGLTCAIFSVPQLSLPFKRSRLSFALSVCVLSTILAIFTRLLLLWHNGKEKIWAWVRGRVPVDADIELHQDSIHSR